MKIRIGLMVLSWVFAWGLIVHADNTNRYAELTAAIAPKIDAFVEAPSQQGFDELVPMVKEMIALDSSDVRGYVYLSKIYMHAGGLMGKKDALLKALAVVNQYQNMEARSGDLSSLKEILSFQIKELEDKAKMERKTQCMLDNMNPPPEIAAARELVQKYYKNAKENSDSTDLLDKAITILNGELVRNRSKSQIYLELSKIDQIKRDYANAYIMWRIAYQLASPEDAALQNRTSNLYIRAKEYDRDADISENRPGKNVGLYFLWLNRETLADALPPGVRVRLDDLVSTAKERNKGVTH